MRIWGLIAVVCLVSAGCGKNDENGAGDEASEGGGEGAAAEDASAVAAEEPADAAPAEPEVQKMPTADEIDPEQPVPVTQLVSALSHYATGTELTVVGYPKFFIGDSGHLQSKVELVAEPGSDKDTPTLIQCDLAEKHPDEVKNTTAVVVKGELYKHWGDAEDPYLWMKECKVVDTGVEVDEDAPLVADPDTPIWVEKLYDAYWGWIGKEVTVSGYYRAITTSKSPEGEILDVRIDISPSSDEPGEVLGCHLPEEEPSEEYKAKLQANRADTLFRGEVAELRFDTWQLEPCQVVNR